jgi:hypothetical protein
MKTMQRRKLECRVVLWLLTKVFLRKNYYRRPIFCFGYYGLNAQWYAACAIGGSGRGLFGCPAKGTSRIGLPRGTGQAP